MADIWNIPWQPSDKKWVASMSLDFAVDQVYNFRRLSGSYNDYILDARTIYINAKLSPEIIHVRNTVGSIIEQVPPYGQARIAVDGSLDLILEAAAGDVDVSFFPESRETEIFQRTDTQITYITGTFFGDVAQGDLVSIDIEGRIETLANYSIPATGNNPTGFDEITGPFTPSGVGYDFNSNCHSLWDEATETLYRIRNDGAGWFFDIKPVNSLVSSSILIKSYVAPEAWPIMIPYGDNFLIYIPAGATQPNVILIDKEGNADLTFIANLNNLGGLDFSNTFYPVNFDGVNFWAVARVAATTDVRLLKFDAAGNWLASSLNLGGWGGEITKSGQSVLGALHPSGSIFCISSCNANQTTCRITRVDASTMAVIGTVSNVTSTPPFLRWTFSTPIASGNLLFIPSRSGSVVRVWEVDSAGAVSAAIAISGSTLTGNCTILRDSNNNLLFVFSDDDGVNSFMCTRTINNGVIGAKTSTNIGVTGEGFKCAFLKDGSLYAINAGGSRYYVANPSYTFGAPVTCVCGSTTPTGIYINTDNYIVCLSSTTANHLLKRLQSSIYGVYKGSNNIAIDGVHLINQFYAGASAFNAQTANPIGNKGVVTNNNVSLVGLVA